PGVAGRFAAGVAGVFRGHSVSRCRSKPIAWIGRWLVAAEALGYLTRTRPGVRMRDDCTSARNIPQRRLPIYAGGAGELGSCDDGCAGGSFTGAGFGGGGAAGGVAGRL